MSQEREWLHPREEEIVIRRGGTDGGSRKGKGVRTCHKRKRRKRGDTAWSEVRSTTEKQGTPSAKAKGKRCRALRRSGLAVCSAAGRTKRIELKDRETQPHIRRAATADKLRRMGGVGNQAGGEMGQARTGVGRIDQYEEGLFEDRERIKRSRLKAIERGRMGRPTNHSNLIAQTRNVNPKKK